MCCIKCFFSSLGYRLIDKPMSDISSELQLINELEGFIFYPIKTNLRSLFKLCDLRVLYIQVIYFCISVLSLQIWKCLVIFHLVPREISAHLN